MTVPRVSAAALCGLALLTGWLLLNPGALASAVPRSPCTELAELSASLDLSSLGDQATIRARAVRLTAALEAEESEPTTGHVTELHREVLTSLHAVLAQSRSTAPDLAAALAPLAEECGVVGLR